MDSDLSHEALKRFAELEGHVGELIERVRALEGHHNQTQEPKSEPAPDNTDLTEHLAPSEPTETKES